MNTRSVVNSTSLVLWLFLTIFYIPSSYAGTKVVIETRHPEEFFVVTCSWYSDFLVLHGGARKVKERVFATSSGKEIDCGSSFFGDGPSIEVMHPFYVTTNTCAYGAVCDRAVSNNIVINPDSIEKYLNVLSRKYKGRELHEAIRGFCATHFGDYYFRKYNSVEYFEIARFKKTYADRLKKFWKRAASFGEFPDVSSDPDKAIGLYFTKSNARLKK